MLSKELRTDSALALCSSVLAFIALIGRTMEGREKVVVAIANVVEDVVIAVVVVFGGVVVVTAFVVVAVVVVVVVTT